jgi:hypothetical protein
MEKPTTDLDLPPAFRTQANMWKCKYLEALKEVQKANKGIRRLRARLDKKVVKKQEPGWPAVYKTYTETK